MAAPAENLFLENSMESQDRIALAVLERDVVHLDKGLSEVKTEVKELHVEMNQRFEKVDRKIDNRFFWTLGALGGTAVAIVGFIVGFIYFFFGVK